MLELPLGMRSCITRIGLEAAEADRYSTARASEPAAVSVMNPSDFCPLIQDIHPAMSLRARASARWHCLSMQNASHPNPHIYHATSNLASHDPSVPIQTPTTYRMLLNGVHHGVSAKHLQAYLIECTFRVNRRFLPVQRLPLIARKRGRGRGSNLRAGQRKNIT